MNMLERVGQPEGTSLSSDDYPISIVIPLYNEENILTEKLYDLAIYFDSLVGEGNWLFVLIENGSTDRTPELAEAAARRWPLSRILHLKKPNVGAAMKAGLRSVTTKWVFMVDIEQWDIPFMTWAWANRSLYDVFIASKRADPTINFQEPHRRILSAALNSALQVLFGFSGTDTHGPKLLNRESLASIIQVCQLDRGQFDTELVLRAVRGRKRVVEVPVEYREWRPHRNLIIKKIVWNLLALRRLHRVMKDVPFEGYVQHYRLTREDVLAESQAADEAPERARV